MCGILTIINKEIQDSSADLISACSIIKHRGPDDEGFLTWVPGAMPKVWAGADTAASTHDYWKYDTLGAGVNFRVGFGHRRLSILDLSPAGHQPMIYEKGGLAISFNGEIYNYLEIKAELELLGHTFFGTSDTEVILHAWAEWGTKCLDKFNGMFAFSILDYNKQELFVVRDRFGVKPVFYYNGSKALYLASEIKQIRTCPEYKPNINEKVVRQYLATGAVDHTYDTFDKEIKYLPQGHYMYLDLKKPGTEFNLVKWYTLQPKKWTGSFDGAVKELRSILIDAVKLRLRSDVPVGSCLSGGLDSSSIVCIAADLLEQSGDHAGQETVTARYESAKHDEWQFAKEVIEKTHARPHQTFPSFKQLQQEVASFIWHQDEPTGSTSQFSQWAVFKCTHDVNLKVMIDGQGADEQLAGYGGNDLAFYIGLLEDGKYGDVLEEAKAYKKEHGRYPIGFIGNAINLAFKSGIGGMIPNKLKFKKEAPISWIKGEEPASIYDAPAHSLNENLLRQLYQEPLPALLRYEDHNSMAWSVESRTPFMDYRLVEFTMGLPARYLYKNGIRKHVLREAMKGILPEAIEKRRDKMGFVTPEELWLKGEGKQWFLDGIDYTCKHFAHIIDDTKLKQEVTEIISGKKPFTFMPWRIVALGIWHKQLTEQYGK